MNDETAELPVDLFARERLTNLARWTEIAGELEARNLFARPLRSTDYNAGYLELLSQLTKVGRVSREEFATRFEEMSRVNRVAEHYAIVVIEDKQTKRIVGASTLFLEYKFIHECAIRARLEDVAVLESHRGKHIGELVVRIIVELARAYKCYKLTLDCTDELKRFYAKNNFVYGSNMLSIRFED